MDSWKYSFSLVLCCYLYSISGFDLEFEAHGVSCHGGNDGNISVSVIGGYPPYKIEWPDLKRDTFVVRGLPAGTYTASVTDDSGFTFSGSAYVTQPPVLTLDAENSLKIRDVTCYDADNGGVSILATGGTPPYLYHWSAEDKNNMRANFTQILAVKPIVFFQEDVGEDIKLSAVPNTLTFNDIEGNSHSGITSIQITSTQTVSFHCNACIDANLYTGIRFWVKVDPSVALDTYMSISDDSTFINNVKLDIRSQDWTQIEYDFSTLPKKNYTSFSISNKSPSPKLFLVDDVVLTPNPQKIQFLDTLDLTKSYPIGVVSSVVGKTGRYSSIITDANGCSISRSFDVHEPPQLIIDYREQDESNVILDISGGSPPYIVKIKNITQPDGDHIEQYLTPGIYDVAIIDANNCTAFTMLTIKKPNELVKRQIYQIARIIMIVVSGLLICYSLLCALFLFRRYSSMHPHHPMFCGLIVLGALLSFTASFSLSLEINVVTCGLYEWLVGLGFVFIYGSLFIKNLMIMKILRNFPKFLSKDSGMPYLFKILGCALLFEVLYLLAWTAYDTAEVREGDYSDAVCYQNLGSLFWAFFFVFKVIIVCLAAFFSFKMSNKFADFVELRHIAFSFYFVVALFLVTIPTVFALGKYPEITAFLKMLLASIGPSFPLFSIMGYLMRNNLSLWRHENKGKGWQELRTVKY